MMLIAQTDYRLVITHATWSAALRALLLDANRSAVGSLKWNNDADRTEFLVHQLNVEDGLPAGDERLPLTDYLVMTVERDSNMTPHDILKQIKPRKSQTVILLTFYHADRQRWDGIVHRDGEITSLDEIHIIGSGMMQLTRHDAGNMLELLSAGRWSRTMGALGLPLWERVHNANVLLIGCGRNGTLAAWQFAGLGVERMTFVDADRLQIENLDSMPGLSLDDIGQPKATALASHLVAFNDELTIRCIQKPVHEILDRLRARFDLIVSCVDSDTARMAASWLSRALLVPQLDIATEVQRTTTGRRLAGDVRLLQPYAGCVNCIGGLANAKQTLYEFAAPPGSMQRGEPVDWQAQRAGSLVHLNSMTVGTAIELWLACLQGEITGSFWQRLTWNNATDLQAEGAEVTRDETCPYCAL